MRTSFDALHDETRPLRELDGEPPAPIRPTSVAAAWTVLSAVLVLLPIAALVLL